MTHIFGLTGGIATGKSTVSSMLASFDIPVIDADVVAREVVEPRKQPYIEIVDLFGSEILQADMTLNRAKLGEIVFANDQKRQQLNKIVHPAVREEMNRQKNDFIRQGFQLVVLDIPLLFENHLTAEVDQTIVVYVSEKTQLKRLVERDHLSTTEAKQRIQAQMPISKKVKLADFVIDNEGTREQTLQQVKHILKEQDL